jgi:hypothetical protein
MNTVKACMLAAFAIMALGGCTTTHTLSVPRGNRIAPVYVEGKQWLQSVKRNTVEVCLLTPTYKTPRGDLLPPAFLVVIRNGGDQTISLWHDDITVTVEGRPVHILTYEEYRDQITRQEDWISAMANSERGPIFGKATPFPQEQMLQEQRGEENDYGRTEDRNQTWGSTGALLAAQRLVDLRRDTELAKSRLALLLDQDLITPGQEIRGVVCLKSSDLSSGHRLRIRVRTGDETHEFVYDVRS